MADPDQRQPLLCFLAGVALSVMGYSFYSHYEMSRNTPTSAKHTPTRLHDAKLEDDIPLKSLVYLVNSSNATIQGCSVKIAIARAMSARYLSTIIAACQKDQPIQLRSQALTVLQLLTQTEQHRPALLEAGALHVLVDALGSKEPEMTELTQRYVAMAICDLIQGSDANKYAAIDLGILDSIYRILTSSMTQKNELKYWTLMILHQISLSDPFPKALVAHGFVGLLAAMARATFGNTNMPKFCMQSLVRLVASVDTIDSKIVLLELLEYDIVDLISVCLRADDIELIYWAAGLMHEFVLKDVATDQFRAIKDIHTILAGLLSAEEMYISRVVLRTIKFMVYGQDAFRQSMVESSIMKKIMQCLNLDDVDVRYWATLCIHAVASQVESHKDILNASEFAILMELAVQQRVHATPFVADILSLICCIWHNDVLLDKHMELVATTLNALLSWEEVEVQYNAASALFNVVAMRQSFAAVIRDKCLDTLLSVCVMSSHERVQLACAKAVLLLTIKYPRLKPRLVHEVVEPLIETCATISQQLLPIMMMQSVVAVCNAGPSAPLEMDSYRRGSEAFGAMTLLDNISLLLAEPPKERVALLSQFQLPPPTQMQLAGAIYALRYLLENDKLMSGVVTGISIRNDEALSAHDTHEWRRSSSSSSNSHLTHDSAVEIHPGYDLNGEHDDNDDDDDDDDDFYVSPLSVHQEDAPMLVSPTNSASSNTVDQLPKIIRQVVDGLVYQALYPVIGDWWNASPQHQAPLDRVTSDEQLARQMYAQILDWIYRESQLITPFTGTPSTNAANATNATNATHSTTTPGAESMMSDSDNSTRDNDNDDSSTASDDASGNGQVAYSQQMIQLDTFSRALESAEQRIVTTRRALEDLDENKRPPHHHRQEKGCAWMDNKVYTGLASRALLVLRSLLRYPAVRRYLVYEMHFVEMMLYMLQHIPSLTDHILTCLGALFNSSVQLPEESLKRCVLVLWRYMLEPTHIQKQKKTFRYYSGLIMTCGSCMISNTRHAHVPFTRLDTAKSTAFCLINRDNQLEARNDSWTFETVVATHYVRRNTTATAAANRFCYQIKLKTNGLLQVGWINEHGQVDAEAGSGIGDDEHSYGYDGNRCKKWHGRYRLKNTNYGIVWKADDLITCAIDLDAGEIRYYQNGIDLGVAFSKVDKTRTWYPALSLSVGQGCECFFGGPLDPLIDIPEGYVSVHDINFGHVKEEDTESMVSSVLSPAQSSRSGEGDDDDLVTALQDMRLSSPDMVGAASPSSASVPDISFADTLRSPFLYVEIRIALQPSSAPSSIAIGWKNALSKLDVALVYSTAAQNATIYVHAREMLNTPFPLTLQDGDILGLIYTDQQQVAFTQNGHLLQMVSLQIPFVPYLAYTSGSMYAKINYGQDPFVHWTQGNHPAILRRTVHILNRYIGKRT
ncbi:hypothetical protein BC940DRAFT_296883 [Gongronella butleri]|nr:hypothetical protein BC940DRAFT_296883 [Gongronella butleri]